MKPAPVLLADYTILLSLHGIITAGRLLYLFLRLDDVQALACSRPNGQLYHSAVASWYNTTARGMEAECHVCEKEYDPAAASH